MERGPDYATTVRDRQRAEWGAVAPGWQRNRERMSGPMSHITGRMVESGGIRPGHRVLDLACGVGDPAFAVADAVGPGGYVLGLDLSREMVEAARSWARQQAVGNVEFRTISSELDPGVPAGSFDVATCRLGLQFLPDPMAALQELREALKPGGRVVASTWGHPERNPNFSLPMEIISRHATLPEEDPDAPGLFALPTPEDLEVLLNTAGFADVESSAFETPVARSKSPESFWHGVSTIAGPLVSLLASLTEEQCRAIREDAVETLGGMFPEGPVELDGEAVVAVGTKTV